MGEEGLPFVSLCELDYLRRIWPRAVFAFMTRYKQDLERKRKESKERFGCTHSGNCTHCGKYIQMDLGKHIAFYHLELAQLWRCLVMWCTIWKGTAQDCIDHMRCTHKVPLSVKAANLAKYFPAWTVTRDQWSDMLMSCISGVEIDTLLFSRVGSPLCHWCRLISRTGSHAAFRGTYLKRLRLRGGTPAPPSACSGPSCSGREVYRQSGKWTYSISGVSQDRVSAPTAASPQRPEGQNNEHPTTEMSSVQTLMKLALPRFAMTEGPSQVHLPWSVTSELPASPAPSQIEPRGGRGLPLFEGPDIVFVGVP